MRILIYWLLIATCLHEGTADAAALRAGKFQASASVLETAGEAWAKRFSGIIKQGKKIKWNIVVPESYDPNRPAGLLVYISPSDSGKIPRRWEPVMAEQNLIWISASRSGNNIDPRRRIVYSLLAPMFISKNYQIDPRRIYVAGLSGGSRVASIVAPEYASVFQGAIYICGVNAWQPKSAKSLKKVQSRRFVFLTGSRDFNQRETSKIYHEYQDAGIQNSLYLEIKNMGHENPSAVGISKAIAYLDGK